MMLLLVLMVFGGALVCADEVNEESSPKTKRGVQGVYHFATGPFSLEPKVLAPAPAPVPLGPFPIHPPFPVAGPLPVAAPVPLPAPLPVFPPPHFAPTAVAFAPPVVAPAPFYKVPVPVPVPYKVPVPVKLAYFPGFVRKYRIRVRVPQLLKLRLDDL